MGKFSENIEKRSGLEMQMKELWKENLETIKRYYARQMEVGKIKKERIVRSWKPVLPPFAPDDGHVYVHVQYDVQGDAYGKNDIIKSDDIDNFLMYEHTKQRFEMADRIYHRD